MPAAETNARVVVAPPPPNWTGDVTALFALLQTNLGVKNPVGWNSFATGTVAPTSDQGPWLKNGTEWYVWNSGSSTYVPQTLTAAFAIGIGTGITLPAGSTTTGIFFLTLPGVGIALYRWVSGAWVFVAGTFSGTTAQRPASPTAYIPYYDTSIEAFIYYKPGFGWVTTHGVKGDIKMVDSTTEVDALTRNPGWEVYTPTKGRAVAGANGAFNGYTDRLPGIAFGAETHTLVAAETPVHDHKVAGSYAQNGGDVLIRQLKDGVYDGSAYPVQAVTSPYGGGGAHNNMQPTLFLIFIRKVQ